MYEVAKALAAECKAARIRAGKDFLDVAVSFPNPRPLPVTIERFEKAIIDDKDATYWPKVPERTVDAYAKATGVDPVKIWRGAINRWAASLATAPQDVAAAGPVGPRLNTVRDAQSKPSSRRAKANRRP